MKLSSILIMICAGLLFTISPAGAQNLYHHLQPIESFYKHLISAYIEIQ